ADQEVNFLANSGFSTASTFDMRGDRKACLLGIPSMEGLGVSVWEQSFIIPTLQFAELLIEDMLPIVKSHVGRCERQ
ncbi:hypothetical protein, partial [Candidatus Nitrotoga sp. 1052]|uniref:hypothetical protein n=1 Tax=Candidatus Nitrotoga sp. 1052 TaxID=2886964 RepID=UPI001EF471C6